MWSRRTRRRSRRRRARGHRPRAPGAPRHRTKPACHDGCRWRQRGGRRVSSPAWRYRYDRRSRGRSCRGRSRCASSALSSRAIMLAARPSIVTSSAELTLSVGALVRQAAFRERVVVADSVTIVAIGAAILHVGNMLDRDHALILGGIEHDHPLRRAAHDADAFDRDADQLAAIRDEHELIAFLHREGANQLAVPLIDRHGDDAFAAAPGDAVFVRAGPLAVAVLRYREHELLVRAELGVALRAEHDLLAVAFALHVLLLFGAAAPHHVRLTHIGDALGRKRLDMSEDGHGNDLVLAFELDAANARRLPALEHADVGDGEADRLAFGGVEQNVVMFAAHGRADDPVALV